MVASTAFAHSVPTARVSTVRAARASAARDEAHADTVLMQRFHDGDEEAFVEIIHRYHGKMYSVAFSLLRNRADAEEIAQDTFVRAHRGLAGFRGDSSLATWLHRIALNLARNRYWHNFRRRRHVTRSFDSVLSEDNPSTLGSVIACEAPGPRQQAATTEFSDLITFCMDRLGPRHREILEQRNIQHCTYDEIARMRGVTIGTVKSRIARARENLRILLAKTCPEFAPDSSPSEWFEPTRSAGYTDYICA